MPRGKEEGSGFALQAKSIDFFKKATKKVELVARPKTESSEDGHRSDGFVDGPRLTISCQGL